MAAAIVPEEAAALGAVIVSEEAMSEQVGVAPMVAGTVPEADLSATCSHHRMSDWLFRLDHRCAPPPIL
jgi:hypothetical protein